MAVAVVAADRIGAVVAVGIVAVIGRGSIAAVVAAVLAPHPVRGSRHPQRKLPKAVVSIPQTSADAVAVAVDDAPATDYRCNRACCRRAMEHPTERRRRSRSSPRLARAKARVRTTVRSHSAPMANHFANAAVVGVVAVAVVSASGAVRVVADHRMMAVAKAAVVTAVLAAVPKPAKASQRIAKSARAFAMIRAPRLRDDVGEG